jgi:hypothetical protein
MNNKIDISKEYDKIKEKDEGNEVRRVIIDDKYFIDIESRQLILKFRYVGTKKDGTKFDAVRTYGYFANLGQLLCKLMKLIVRDKTVGEVSLEEFREILEDSSSYIKNVCDRISY